MHVTAHNTPAAVGGQAGLLAVAGTTWAPETRACLCSLRSGRGGSLVILLLNLTLTDCETGSMGGWVFFSFYYYIGSIHVGSLLDWRHALQSEWPFIIIIIR